GQVFSTMTITHAGDHLEVIGDWSSINPDSYRIDLYFGEELVASEAGLATGTLLIDVIDIWIIDCRTPTHLTGTIHAPQLGTATFTIPGRGSYEADNWEIMAMGFDKVATFQHEIDMLTNMPAFGIFEEVTLPGPDATDCNRNKMPDYGEIGAGLAADENGDGILDECQ
ncbi:MAG: hypothetical protein V3T72_11345, partial [Thermoanaerobaculia bacterium]